MHKPLKHCIVNIFTIKNVVARIVLAAKNKKIFYLLQAPLSLFSLFRNRGSRNGNDAYLLISCPTFLIFSIQLIQTSRQPCIC